MNTHFFIIPGNPGIVGYYDDFANKLRALGYKVSVLSYGNFSDDSEKFLSINEEVSHKKDQIISLIESCDRNILIGHSIGAWISLRLIDEIQFTKCIMIFPFIKKDISIKQFAINFLLHYRGSISSLYDSIRRSNYGKLFLTYVANSLSMSYNSNSITRDYFLNKNVVRNCLNLAKSEFDTLEYFFDIEKLLKFKDKLVFYYCENDIWAPISDYKFLSSIGFTCELLNECAHDFCVRKDDVEIVSKRLIEDLK
jgi:hypothetical protein